MGRNGELKRRLGDSGNENSSEEGMGKEGRQKSKSSTSWEPFIQILHAFQIDGKRDGSMRELERRIDSDGKGIWMRRRWSERRGQSSHRVFFSQKYRIQNHIKYSAYCSN